MDKLMDALLGMGTAGPLVGLLFWLWWQERTERRELAGKVMDLAVASTAAIKDSTAALQAIATKVGRDV
jgi:hypothetical protein